MRLIIFLLLPFIGVSQTFKGLTIKNESKAVITVKENLTLSAVPYNAPIWFTADSLAKVDSIILNGRSLGKVKFAAQFRLSSVEGKIQGKVVPVQFDSTGWQRIAIDAKLFGLDSVKSMRWYITSGDKAGFEFSEIAFKKTYVAPPTVEKPKPEPPATSCQCKDSVTLRAGKGISITRNEKGEIVISVQ